jgi:hypothetical protein
MTKTKNIYQPLFFCNVTLTFTSVMKANRKKQEERHHKLFLSPVQGQKKGDL